MKATCAAFSTDVFAMLPALTTEIVETQQTFGVRCHAASRHPPKATRRARFLQRVGAPRLPSRLLRVDHATTIADFTEFADRYDVTLIERLEDYLILSRHLASPVAIDFDDLESDLLRQQWKLHMSREGRNRERPTTAAPTWLRIKQAVHELVRRRWVLPADSLRWRHVERRSLRRVDLGLFSNQRDQMALRATSNAALIPNGIERVNEPAGRWAAASPPTIGFWGAMGYEPNRDAVEYLLSDIWPRLRKRRPGVELLIAGRGSDALELEATGDITCVGFVPEMRTLLSQLDVALVPLRLGVGTRIKILEAWAHGIPVVSTSRGAFGLEGPGEIGILIADDPDDIVGAILEAVDVEATRSRLIEVGRQRVAQLTWDQIEASLTGALRRVAEHRAT